MMFLIGLCINLIILCLAIFILPIFTYKKRMLILMTLTTLSFGLSFYMGKLYSPIIGVGIFLLLIGSLALLIGKNHTWIDKNKLVQPRISRRKRFKDSLLAEGIILESMSSKDDYMLYRASTGSNDAIEPHTDLIYRKEDTIDFDSIQEPIPFAEVAVTLDYVENASYSTKENDKVHEEASIYKVNDETSDIKNKLNELEQKTSEELSDQWMQNRIEALFDKPEAVQNPVILEEENKVPEELRYDDLSTTYFNQVRSEKSGTKE
jgi:hypothetical protein